MVMSSGERRRCTAFFSAASTRAASSWAFAGRAGLLFTQQIEGLLCQVNGGVAEGAQAGSAEWFRTKDRILSRGRQRQMEFSGSLRQESGELHVVADSFLGLRGQSLVRQGKQAALGNFIRLHRGPRRAFVVIRQGVQSKGPGVALVGNIGLQNCETAGLGRGAGVFHVTGDGGRIGEEGIRGQEGADFDIWINAFLQAPEKFQHQALAKYSRRVALLDFHHRRLQPPLRGLPESAQRSGMSGCDFAARARKVFLLNDGVEQEFQKRWVLHGVIQDVLLALIGQLDA